MQEKYPGLEADLEKLVMDYIAKLVDASGQIAAMLNSHRVMEGQDSVIVRGDEPPDSIEMRRISSSSEVAVDTILYGTLDQILESIRPLAEEIAISRDQMILEVLNETTEKTGNLVEGSGRPMSMELIVELLDKMHIDFDELGKIRMPTLIADPMMARKMNELIESPETPEDRSALNALIQRKKAEWRAREADRTLVG